MNSELRRALEKIYREEQLRRYPPQREPPSRAVFREREHAYGMYWSNPTGRWPIVDRVGIPSDIMSRIQWQDEMAEPEWWTDRKSKYVCGRKKRSVTEVMNEL